MRCSSYLCCSVLVAFVAGKQDQSGEFLEKQLKKLTDKKVKCRLKKITLATLENLRLTTLKNDDAVLVCYYQALQDTSISSSHGYLWTVLGTIFKSQGAKSPMATSFKNAQKLTGKMSPFIKDWHFIGPFVIGKMELDGDPLEAYAGIRNVSKYRYQKASVFYSELVPGGEIKWSIMKQASAQSTVQVKTTVNWNDLVSSIGSLGITEWQGWVVGELAVNEKDQNIMVQCLGVHTVYIDDILVAGDVYHRDKYWYGVKLDQGLHTVYIRLRTKVVASFKCSFKIAKPDFEIFSPHFLPDLMDGYLFSGYLALPIANYHSTEFLKITKVSLQDVTPSNIDLDIEIVDEDIKIAPGQIFAVPVKLISSDSKVISHCTDTDDAELYFNIKFLTSSGIQTVPIALRCRKFRQSFLFTFVDHDGSIQHAAAIPPLKDCSGQLCPTLLTLHGTTISPQNQADSYKQMVDGEFQFGSHYAWLLAPTRHGAHNWEGPGLLTALTALETLGQITSNADFWLTNKADTHHVIFAGHSMGGHGAWHIAVQYPDRCLGLMSLAGWIKKEEYGDSNLFFRHDIATSHTDPAVKAVMEACIAENDVDRHAVHLQGVPVIARIGADDRTVHPFFVRRMYRLLKEERVAVNYSEVTGKEHWWWDTSKSNDGGVVNDKVLRDFTNYQLSDYLFPPGTCSNEDCSEDLASSYRSGAARNFTLVCYNPALGEGVAGIKVLQQITPYRQSVIQGYAKDDHVVLLPTNVRRFTISEPPNRFNWRSKTLQVDDSTVFSTDDVGLVVTSAQRHFCKEKGTWKVCLEDIYELGLRGPLNLGPARRVAENPFLIVIGSQGSDVMQQYILQAAVYIANLFFLTSDTSATIVKDSEIDIHKLGEKNVILLGNTEENIHTEKYLSKIPVKMKSNAIHLQGCAFKHYRIGVLSLAPNGVSKLALLLMANSIEGFLDIVSMSTPTIPPMTRSPFSNLVPDYVITGPDFRRKGPGGYLCAGFWGNSWEYRSDISSCTCDL